MKSMFIGILMTGLMASPVMADTICNRAIDYVNVRKGPSARDSDVIDKLSNGHQVVSLKTTTNIDGFDWTYVVYNGYLGRMGGWVLSKSICDF